MPDSATLLLLIVSLAALAARVGALAVEPRVVSFSLARVEAPALSAAGYEKTLVTNADGSVEHRCYFRSQHFLSVLRDPLGAFAVRMHPGVDVNGWPSPRRPRFRMAAAASSRDRSLSDGR